MKKQKSGDFWAEGGFVESISKEDAEKKMKTFHKGHDEDMNFNCKKMQQENLGAQQGLA